jgi:hypothetical protein
MCPRWWTSKMENAITYGNTVAEYTRVSGVRMLMKVN